MAKLLAIAAVGFAQRALGQGSGIPAASLATNVNLEALPYDYNSLEPFISEATMRVHHLGHHQAYADKTNAALHELRLSNRTRVLADKGLPWLLKHLDIVDEPVRTSLRNVGGGFWNHDFFFGSLAPSSNSTVHPDAPGGKFDEASPLAAKIQKDFGSFEAFKGLFEATAIDYFGSGWAWLSLASLPGDDQPALTISSTANQENPNMQYGDNVPLLGLDLWEHAYYLDYKNKRAAYVKSFWNVVNWAVVSRRYEEAVAKWGVVDPKDEVPPGFKSSASDENSLFGAFFDQFGDVSRGASGGDVEVEISVAGAGGAVGAAGSVPVLSSDDGGLAELMKEFEAMRQEAEAEAAKAQAEAEAAKAAAAEAAAKAQAAEAAVSKPEAAAKTAEAAVPRAAAAVEPVAEAAVPAPQEQPAAPAQAEAAAAPPAQEQPQQQAAPATPTPAATSEKKKGSKGSKKASKAK